MAPQHKQPQWTCLTHYHLLKSNRCRKSLEHPNIIPAPWTHPWQQLLAPLQQDRLMGLKMFSLHAINWFMLQLTQMPPFASLQATWSLNCIQMHGMYLNSGERAEWVVITFWSATNIPSIVIQSSPCLPSSKTLLDQHLKLNWLHFYTCKQTIPLWVTLAEMRHEQIKTVITTKNSLAHGLITKTVSPKATKSMDMSFNWLKCWQTQNQFVYQWKWQPCLLSY